MVEDQSVLSRDGFHSVDHWARVSANGRKLSPLTGANLAVVELFALFHDSRRLSEGSDPEHGRRAAKFATEMRAEWFEVSDREMFLLVEAIEFHSDGLTEAEITIQTCWDSDRLDLGRVGITPDVRFLCTEAARSDEILDWAHKRAANSRSPAKRA